MDINEYFKNYKFLKNKIIVISSKDEPSKYFNLFTSKSLLGLNESVLYRNSYVAVIDFKRKFVFEHVDKDKYCCSYQVKKKFIDILSSGFDSGNKSSIKIDENEFSLNHRGLNFAIFHYKTLDLIDKFYCDTYADKTLQIIRT